MAAVEPLARDASIGASWRHFKSRGPRCRNSESGARLTLCEDNYPQPKLIPGAGTLSFSGVTAALPHPALGQDHAIGDGSLGCLPVKARKIARLPRPYGRQARELYPGRSGPDFPRSPRLEKPDCSNSAPDPRLPIVSNKAPARRRPRARHRALCAHLSPYPQ